jgi:hypothetical protein
MTKEYCIVEFLDDNCVEAVPQSWVTEGGKSAYWPSKYSDAKVTKAISDGVKPDKQTWKCLDIRKLGQSGMYVY